MRKSDRILAAGIAAIVWLVAGYALTSRPMAQRVRTQTTLDVHPSQAVGGLRTAFL